MKVLVICNNFINEENHIKNEENCAYFLGELLPESRRSSRVHIRSAVGDFVQTKAIDSYPLHE